MFSNCNSEIGCNAANIIRSISVMLCQTNDVFQVLINKLKSLQKFLA
jgi:hypothetical protein